MKQKKVLLTGAMGFVGHHMVEAILKDTDWDIVMLDRLDCSGNPNRLLSIECWESEKHRVRSVFWDLKAELNSQVIKQLGGPFDYILHLAAGSHVDRSIDEPMSFFMDNGIGTVNLLEYARHGGLLKSQSLYAGISEGRFDDLKIESMEESYGGSRFLYFSTDEVFGPAPMDESFKGFKEWDRLNPNNPYAAAKAAAEMAVISYANTYRIPCLMTNTMNIFGERQHPEKFIPLVINSVLKGDKVYIHANKEKTQAGKRHYLHARNICAATLWAIQYGSLLDGSANQGRYNVVGEVELDNLELAQLISSLVHEVVPTAPDLDYELVDFHSSRPGHDLRYALDGTLLKEAGFEYPVAFEESLRKMVRWTLAHPEWL